MFNLHAPRHSLASVRRDLTTYMLGPPRVEWRGTPLSIPRRQTRALLYRLAVAERPVPREYLGFLFWPDTRESLARQNLSRLLNLLRNALPSPDLLHTHKDLVSLDTDRLWVDTREFARLHARLAQGEADLETLHRLAALYNGPFLAGFSLPNSPEFDLWLTRERQRWERCYLEVLDTLIDLHTRRGMYLDAISWARRYLEIDELAESVHRRLIRLYAATGDRSAALRQFERCAAILERELGVSPLPETRAAYQAALAGAPQVTTQPSMPMWTTLPTLDVVMVGRGDALANLRRAYAETRRGQGRVVFVSGEPGIGKSRVLQEFIAHLESAPCVLVGSGHEAEQGVPYAPVVDALRGRVADINQAILSLPAEDQAEIAHLLPEVIPYAKIPAPPDPTASSQPARLVRALTDLMLTLARYYGHLILCVDDLHWADDATLAWLSVLLRHIRQAPVLLLTAHRSEEAVAVASLRDEAERLGLLQEVHLSGLDEQDVRHLVYHLSGERSVAHSFIQRLHRESGGNPFFLLELLRAMVEAGIPWPEADNAETDNIAPQEDTWPLPESLYHTIRSRLARLSPRDRQVLEAAAVLGHNATLDLLQTTSGREEDEVVQALDMLVARHILVERKGFYSFAHDLIRNVVYRDLGYGRRRLLHRRAGRALERARPTDAVSLAQHFEQGEDVPRAVRYYLQAGDRARDLYACREAVRHYERALILQRERQDDEGAARTLMRLGLAHHMAFAYDLARQAYDEGFLLWQRCTATQPRETLSLAPHPLRVDWPHVLTLDPARARDANSGGVIDQLFSGLVEWSPTMNVVPEMALRWEVTDEGRRYLIHLREDVHWSDGRPVTAHDFEYAWKRALSPQANSPHASLLYVIEGARAYHQGEVEDARHVRVRAVDATTLEVSLTQACSYFLHLLAHPVTRPVPRHVVETWGSAWATPPHLVTNGPFRLAEWSWGQSLTLVRDPAYRGRAQGNVEEVILHLMVTLEAKAAKLRMFEEDRLDVLGLWWGIPPARVAHMLRHHGGELISGLNLFVRYLAFDVTRPPFDEGRIRRAFAHATDRETLAHVILAGYDDPALGGLIPPGMPGHSPAAGLPYDPERARALLADAGHAGGRGLSPILLRVPQGFEAIGAYMRDQWHRVLGVRVHLEALPWEVYLAHLQTPDGLQAFLSGWVARYPDPDTFMRTSNFRALTHWQHPEYEDLVERARGIPDQTRRLRLYRQADALLMHEAPIVPILYARRNFLLKPWVHTFPISPLKWWFWKDVVLLPQAA